MEAILSPDSAILRKKTKVRDFHTRKLHQKTVPTEHGDEERSKVVCGVNYNGAAWSTLCAKIFSLARSIARST